MRSIIAVLVVLGALALFDSWRHRLGACLTGQPDRCRRDRAGYRIERTGRVDEPLVGAGVAHAERARPKEQAAGRRSGARGCGGSYRSDGRGGQICARGRRGGRAGARDRLRMGPALLAHRLRGRSFVRARDRGGCSVTPSVAPGARPPDRPGSRRRGWSHPWSNRRRGVVPGRCSRLFQLGTGTSGWSSSAGISPPGSRMRSRWEPPASPTVCTSTWLSSSL